MTIFLTILGIILLAIIVLGIYVYIKEGPYLGKLKQHPRFRNCKPEDLNPKIEFEWEEVLELDIISLKWVTNRYNFNPKQAEEFSKKIFEVKCPICEKSKVNGEILVLNYGWNPAPLVGLYGFLSICATHRKQLFFFQTGVS